MAVEKKTFSVRDMVYCALFAVLIAVCSWISIPTTVPFTLQTFAVFATVGCLGGKRGTVSVLIYLLLGAIGMPVFAGFKGGLGAMLGNTGGYIVGFLFSALVMWALEKVLGRKPWALAVAMVAGLVVCYAFGTVWFVEVYTKNVEKIGMWTALGWCVFPFIVPDLVKIALALVVSSQMKKLPHSVGPAD